MASFPGVIAQRMAREAEAKIRSLRSIVGLNFQWNNTLIKQIADWLYNRVVTERTYGYINYYNLARSVVRNARDAATMQANPQMAILNLGKAPGVPQTFPTYEYRTVVVGRSVDGSEMWSTLVYIYSQNALNASQIEQEASSRYMSALEPPGFPTSPPTVSPGVARVDVFVVSAGTK